MHGGLIGLSRCRGGRCSASKLMKSKQPSFLLPCCLIFVLVLAVHASWAPWFNGWCTRITDEAAQRSITLILGTFQAAFSQGWDETYVAVLVASPNGSLHTEQAFPDPATVSIEHGGKKTLKLAPHDLASFVWKSSLGTLSVNGSSSKLDFVFPSGLEVAADLTDRVPWDAARARAGPEGWAGRLPPSLLPTHYYVHSLGSAAEYTVNGEAGSGFAHQEANYGQRFPVAFVWIQGVTDRGSSQLLLTGGKFTIAGVTAEQYIVAYRSPNIQWNFRSINLDKLVASVDSCGGAFSIVATSRDGRRRLEISVTAPKQTFSEPVYIPTANGFSNAPGSVESHTATATLRAYMDNSEVAAEAVNFEHTALEFGGEYVCQSDEIQEVSATQPALAFAYSQRGRRAATPALANPKRASFLQRSPSALHSSSSRAPRRVGRAALAQQGWLAIAACFTSAALLKLFKGRGKRGKKRTLQEGIADFYDASSGVWIEIWGEHMHHGYYPDDSWKSLVQHKEAQVRMIEEILRWAEAPQPDSPDAPQHILDVGCGVGGSSRHLQRKYNCKVQGITLSPNQRDRARNMSKMTGQDGMCNFDVADALHMPFPDNSFDLIWSLESGEHMPNKQQFMKEMFRVCKPNGRVILVTWVHRDLQKGEKLSSGEHRLLKWINKAYHLPAWCSISDYAHIAKEQLGATEIRTTDWTNFIKPFWSAVIRTAIQPRGWWALARGGWETFRGALVMPLMNQGYRMGTIKFGLFTGCKPTSAEAPSVPTTTSETPPSTMSACATYTVPQASTRCIGSARPVGRSALARHRRRALQKTQEARVALSSSSQLSETVTAVWDFTRPHTLIGTFISLVSVHAFMVAPLVHTSSVSLAQFLVTTLGALVPALLMNVYITGLNQIYDVEIDRQNKPYLQTTGQNESANAYLL
eukprot:TRINITY_DN41459_c0_g1_i2.p1 TRINITY_DN41459_c0_g1~~TRINITY_DN41459_c0_g1_i2.p1  ORF type:complete len:922 (-),score=130.07 TRINITY_DN41459_c0_g1_i2:102-2867(-)